METSTLEAEKPPRRFEFAEKDADILREFRLNPVMDLPRLVEILALSDRPRSEDPLRRRLQGLRQKGYLRRIALPDAPDGKLNNRGYLVHYPTTAAWRWLLDNGEIPAPVGMGDTRKSKSIPHDLALTDRYISLVRSIPHSDYRLKWERLAKFVRFGSRVPDIYFELETEDFEANTFWEEEHTDEWGYEDGKSERVRKCDDYEEYAQKFPKPFRVVFCLRSKDEAVNFAAKLHDLGGIYNKRRWFITWEAAAQENMMGFIFISPPDFEKRTYSISGEFLE